MKKLSILSILCCMIYACSNNPAPTTVPSGGSDFLKQEKQKPDLKIIDPKAKVIKVSLKAMGNTMAEMSYDKDTIRVPSGCTVELSFENASTDQAMQHNFVLIEKGSAKTVADAGLKAGASKGFVEEMDEIYIYTKLTLPKEKTSITFTAPPGNIYDFICTYPGHYARMKGVFIVE